MMGSHMLKQKERNKIMVEGPVGKSWKIERQRKVEVGNSKNEVSCSWSLELGGWNTPHELLD